MLLTFISAKTHITMASALENDRSCLLNRCVGLQCENLHTELLHSIEEWIHKHCRRCDFGQQTNFSVNQDIVPSISLLSVDSAQLNLFGESKYQDYLRKRSLIFQDAHLYHFCSNKRTDDIADIQDSVLLAFEEAKHKSAMITLSIERLNAMFSLSGLPCSSSELCFDLSGSHHSVRRRLLVLENQVAHGDCSFWTWFLRRQIFLCGEGWNEYRGRLFRIVLFTPPEHGSVSGFGPVYLCRMTIHKTKNGKEWKDNLAELLTSSAAHPLSLTLFRV